MKVLTIHGVPYLTNEKNEVFLYQHPSSTKPHLLLGTWDSTTQKLTMREGWEESVKGFVDDYRKDLKARTEEAMDRAKEIQGFQGQ